MEKTIKLVVRDRAEQRRLMEQNLLPEEVGFLDSAVYPDQKAVDFALALMVKAGILEEGVAPPEPSIN